MLKKIICSIFIFSFIFALPAKASEKVEDFFVQIRVNKDSSIHIQEKIKYDFDDLQRHGIYRYIPYQYEINNFNYKTNIQNVQVTDENSVPINFSESNESGQRIIKIGDPDVLLSGEKTFVIDYDVLHVINFFNDHDELYWNITGGGWDVPVTNARASLSLPGESALRSKQFFCYAGPAGLNEKCPQIQPILSVDSKVVGANFASSILSENEGMTISVSFDKNIVLEPSGIQKFWKFFGDNYFLAFPLFVLIFLIIYWYLNGRDSSSTDPIIAQYESPENLSPAMVGTIVDGKVHTRDLSAEMIYLAIKGYFKITSFFIKKNFFSSKSYFRFDKLKKVDGELEDYQVTILKAIFRGGDSVNLSKLKSTFYRDFEIVKKQLYKAVVDRNYFVKSPIDLSSSFLFSGILFFILSALNALFFDNLSVTLGFLISSLFIIVFSFVMPKKTPKGAKTKNYILGLKEYIRVAEKERIKFHNAPEKNPATFEKFLPFAMAFGLEGAWVKSFKTVYKEFPSWYDNPYLESFSTVNFTKELTSFSPKIVNNLFQNVASSFRREPSSGFIPKKITRDYTPSKPSSPGSEGTSGGGFGGGGGGSW